MTKKSVARTILASFMLFAGITHFTKPKPYTAMVPKYLPARRELVYISGFFEILGGLGLLIPRVRAAAGSGLVALLIAVFPANVYMAQKNPAIGGKHYPLLLWLRLPLQLGLIKWAWWCSRDAGE